MLRTVDRVKSMQAAEPVDKRKKKKNERKEKLDNKQIASVMYLLSSAVQKGRLYETQVLSDSKLLLLSHGIYHLSLIP